MPVEIKKGVYLVGAVDWDRRYFHGHTYSTRTGTTYNSYLIIDEKVTLIDTVLPPFAGDMIEKISQIISPDKIDYIVINHGEPDHSGALPRLLELAPHARVFGTGKCLESLSHLYHREFDFQAVKTGDRLALGKKTLMFLQATMLHWPDTMFSYLMEEGLLFSNDVFGQHYASSERFDDEVDPGLLMYEAARYYANIMWPYSRLMLKKLEEIKRMELAISMIAPSHGIIWRADPAKAMKAHFSWAGNKKKKKAVIVYETMYGATAQMARKIAEGLQASGVCVKLYEINASDRSDIVTEMLDAGGYLFGSSTHDGNILPTLAGFLDYMKGLKPQERIAAAFGSYGWSGGAVSAMEALFEAMKLDCPQPGLSFQYFPDDDNLRHCYDYGAEFAGRL